MCVFQIIQEFWVRRNYWRRRSGTELDTKNVLIESAYFDPRSIRKTAKQLNIDTDAKFRFERGIDPYLLKKD